MWIKRNGYQHVNNILKMGTLACELISWFHTEQRKLFVSLSRMHIFVFETMSHGPIDGFITKRYL